MPAPQSFSGRVLKDLVMHSIKAMLSIMTAATCCICTAAYTQPAPSELGPEALSSVRPSHGEEGPSIWTAAKMHQAQPVPLPKIDPEALSAAVRKRAANASSRP
jgi:hypothetical protein